MTVKIVHRDKRGKRSAVGFCRSGLLTCAAWALATVPVAAPIVRAQEARQNFDIAAGSLDQALQRYMALTGRQLLYRSQLVEGRRAHAVMGSMDADKALRKLIGGYPIAVSHQGRNVYILSPQASPPPRASAQTPARTQRAPQLVAPRPKPVRAPDMAASEVTVTVTGTNIRSAAPPSSPVISMTATDIARSGAGTVAEALALLPQNFGGMANEDTSLTGSDRVSINPGLGSSINLRGLGSDATLTLVNGRRAAGAGGKGDFTDLSSIPAVAVERVEVLADGASALYGSDAIGGVVNILLRKDFEGAESRMRLGTVTRGGSEEIIAGQVVGARWSTGHILAAYEYQHRGRLPGSARKYTRSADLRPLGGHDYRQYFSVPGTIVVLDPVTRTYVPAYAIPDGQDGTDLAPGDFIPGASLSSPRAHVDLLSRQDRHSLFVSGEQELTDGLTFYVEGRYSDRKFDAKSQPSLTIMSVTRSNPWFVSPTGGSSVAIAYDFGRDIGPILSSGRVRSHSVTAGVRAELGGDWQVDAYMSHARQVDRQLSDHLLNSTALNEALGLTADNPATPYSAARDGYFNPFGDGSSNSAVITDFIGSGFIRQRYSSELLNGSLIADGTIFDLPGGPVKLAFGTQAREEDFSRSIQTFASGVTPPATVAAKANRTIVAVFGELAVPLVGSGNARPGLQRLDLSLAVRHERYSDFGSTTNPKIGLVWEPTDGLQLRGSWGTSFRAPALPEIFDPFRVSYTQLPTTGGGNLPVLSLRGGNRDLEPEKAKSLSLGFKVQPKAVPGFGFEANYFQTRFSNRIGQPVTENILQALTNPIYAPYVTLIDPAHNAADMARVLALLAVPGSSVPTTFAPASFRAIIDGRYVNSARVDVRGVDLLVRQSLTLGSNRLNLSINSTILIDYKDQLTPASPMIERVGTLGNPVDFRARGTLDWARGDVGATLSVNHVGSYTDNISVPARPISSWTGVDLQLRYEPRATEGWRKGLSLALTAQNLFDRDPPFVDRNLGFAYDPANADVLGRFLSMQVKKRW
ncbi:TonB-dependent receptor [Sphingobium aromaticivastans]|uniref:TonB-dependent receptor n=1 Tax=Sphingobium aromaticivastans TaxID=1778665 RepID=UPI003018421D